MYRIASHLQRTLSYLISQSILHRDSRRLPYLSLKILQLVNEQLTFMLWWMSHIASLYTCHNGMYKLNTMCIVWNKTPCSLAYKNRLCGENSRFSIPGGSVGIWLKKHGSHSWRHRSRTQSSLIHSMEESLRTFQFLSQDTLCILWNPCL
jgi:hypothetical protein